MRGLNMLAFHVPKRTRLLQSIQKTMLTCCSTTRRSASCHFCLFASACAYAYSQGRGQQAILWQATSSVAAHASVQMLAFLSLHTGWCVRVCSIFAHSSAWLCVCIWMCVCVCVYMCVCRVKKQTLEGRCVNER